MVDVELWAGRITLVDMAEGHDRTCDSEYGIPALPVEQRITALILTTFSIPAIFYNFYYQSFNTAMVFYRNKA